MNDAGRLYLRDRMEDWKNLIDLLFEGIVCTLKKEVDVVYKVEILFDPRDGDSLDGLLWPMGQKNYIYIKARPENRDSEGQTLLHEILHINFGHRKKEDDLFIQKMTALLWNEFSESQKRMLMDCIPEEALNAEITTSDITTVEALPFSLEEPKIEEPT